MQCRIKRSMLHLEEVVCGPLNVLADVMTVSRPVKQSAHDEHVQSALQSIRPLWCLLSHGRRSSPDARCSKTFDHRLSKGQSNLNFGVPKPRPCRLLASSCKTRDGNIF